MKLDEKHVSCTSDVNSKTKNILFFWNPEKKEISKIFKMSQFRASSIAIVIALAVAVLLFVAKDVEAGVVENLDEGTVATKFLEVWSQISKVLHFFLLLCSKRSHFFYLESGSTKLQGKTK